MISRGVHPHSRETLRTMSAGYGTDRRGGRPPRRRDRRRRVGGGDRRRHERRVPAAAELPRRGRGPRGAVAGAAKRTGALLVCACDPLPLGILEAPGELGVDVGVGEGQTLGNRLDYGGPSFGLLRRREEHLRRMPGRIAGETTDVDGRRGFVLTLQTREQHIRREKATSNICTAQALNALGGRRLPVLAGPRGDRRARRAARAPHRLRARARWPRSTACQPLHEQPVVREFAWRSTRPWTA